VKWKIEKFIYLTSSDNVYGYWSVVDYKQMAPSIIWTLTYWRLHW